MNSKTKKKTNKCIIDEYNSLLYPVGLVVVKNINTKKIMSIYDITEEELEDMALASTIYSVLNKKTKKWYGMILLSDSLINSTPLEDQIGTCSHEALHYVLHLMDAIGQKYDALHAECLCYLQDWATKCIFNTLKK